MTTTRTRTKTRHDCSRDGCTGTYSETMRRRGRNYCSAVCCYVDLELDRVIANLQEHTDTDTETHLMDAYATMVHIADLVTEYQKHLRLARSTGGILPGSAPRTKVIT